MSNLTEKQLKKKIANEKYRSKIKSDTGSTINTITVAEPIKEPVKVEPIKIPEPVYEETESEHESESEPDDDRMGFEKLSPRSLNAINQYIQKQIEAGPQKAPDNASTSSVSSNAPQEESFFFTFMKTLALQTIPITAPIGISMMMNLYNSPPSTSSHSSPQPEQNVKRSMNVQQDLPMRPF
jgi:hypothetical protein